MKPLRYAYLTPDHYPQLYRTFMEAFSDYALDMRYMNEHHLLSRWIKNAMSYESSVAAFDGDRMVGFTVVGLDDWKGERAAFDAGTGVIREYRGFGVAPAIFDLAIRGLRDKGVKKFVLEVLQTNKSAVGTYKKLGFGIAREFDCFELRRGNVRLAASEPAERLIIETVGKGLLPLMQSFADWPPSWETSFASMARIPDELTIYGARFQDQWAGFAAYYPGLNWIMNVVVDPAHRRRGIATRLMARLIHGMPDGWTVVKLVNAAHSDRALLAFLDRLGFEVYARQYEMEFDL